MAGEQRPAPPPYEANDLLVTAVITAGWAVALVVLAVLYDRLPGPDRWWLWTCVAGLVFGLFGLWYIPIMKRGRLRAAGRQARDSAGAGQGNAGPGQAE
jgi:hypothetical protein